MIGRVLLPLAACLLLTACGNDAKQPATTAKAPIDNSTATATGPRLTQHRDIAGAGVGTREFAAVRRLAAYGRPVYCGGRRKNMVALTFDDGPGPYTHFVLKRLRRNNMRATFFLNTKNFSEFASLIPSELKYGTVGDHTATHAFLPGLSTAGMHQEIDSAQDDIGKQAGFPIELFRPPYGARNPAIDAHVKSRNMLQIIWNADSRDSLGANWAQIRAGVIASLAPGAIILMHDNRGQTVRALPDILHAVRHKHLRAVTLPELIAGDPPSFAQLRAGPHGCAGTR
jgi:peptidoglycan/xylan/chitin deacetylase (PgdA/CDA1 family)